MERKLIQSHRFFVMQRYIISMHLKFPCFFVSGAERDNFLHNVEPWPVKKKKLSVLCIFAYECNIIKI